MQSIRRPVGINKTDAANNKGAFLDVNNVENTKKTVLNEVELLARNNLRE